MNVQDLNKTFQILLQNNLSEDSYYKNESANDFNTEIHWPMIETLVMHWS